jgi:hypothetical protein
MQNQGAWQIHGRCMEGSLLCARAVLFREGFLKDGCVCLLKQLSAGAEDIQSIER